METLVDNDWYRLLMGKDPLAFLAEVVVRTVVIYLALQVTLRYMGKRMTGQLTLMEMTVMITLGAIIAAPMQIPDRGVLHGIIILCCALGYHRVVNAGEARSIRMEQIVHGKEVALVKDGVLQIQRMRKEHVSRQQIYASLRNDHIYNLGRVKRAYLEACGLISIYQFKDKKIGLSLVPPREHTSNDAIQESNAHKVCSHCGIVQDRNKDKSDCDKNRDHHWITATYS